MKKLLKLLDDLRQEEELARQKVETLESIITRLDEAIFLGEENE